MLVFNKNKFRGVDGTVVRDAEHIEDHGSAEEIGRVRLGKLCLYYRDLGRQYFVPYPYIDRAYGKISDVHPDDSPAYYYYRLILVHDGKEFANLIFDRQEEVTQILDRLVILSPDMKRGYEAPPETKKKSWFSQ